MNMSRARYCPILFLALAMPVVPAFAQTPLGTAFTYQGELTDGGVNANGTYDIRFRLFEAASGGSQIGPTLCINDQVVTGGRFSTSLDFGSVFAGDVRYIEIEVRSDSGLTCDNGSGFMPLLPRQVVSATPNAVFASTSGSAATAASAVDSLNLGGRPAASIPSLTGNNTFTGVLTMSNALNVFAGSASGLTNLNASNLATGTVPGGRLAGTYGNALTFSSSANAFTGNGANLAGLNAANLSSGTVPGARLAGTYANALIFSNAANSFTGDFTGDGSALTNLNANSISSGTLGSGRLPNSVARTNIANAFGNFTNTFAGLVGIGTTSPAAPLHVTGSNGSSLQVVDFPATGSTQVVTRLLGNAAGPELRFQRAAGGIFTDIGQTGTGDFVIQDSDATRFMVQTTTGNVGIGTTTPAAPLDVAGKLSILSNGTIRATGVQSTFGSHNGMIEAYYGDADRYGVAQVSGVGLALYTSSTLPAASIQLGTMTGATSFSPVLTVRNSGNVGIGTTTPGTRLSLGNLVDATKPSIAVFESGTNRSGLGREPAAMTFWAGGQMHAKLRDDGMFEVKAIQINGGADLVERFDSQHADIQPGMLMVIDPANPGELMPSTFAYDTKVAGVISGAGGVNPGIHLSQKGVMDGEHSVAMTGRVYVKCTTDGGTISPGDLLTTSDFPGHAMKASDASRRPGAVIGKAMTGLENGNGLVLVLVNLQ